MNFLLLLLLLSHLCIASGLIELSRVTPAIASELLSDSCPPLLILCGPPGPEMSSAEDFLSSLVPSLLEELPLLSCLRLETPDQFPGLRDRLRLGDSPVQFVLRRGPETRVFGGKLTPTNFVTFVWSYIEDYVTELSDVTFERITGVYTWEESDWLVQFYAEAAYPEGLWSELGYRLKGFSRMARVNVTSCPYVADRFYPILSNETLPAALFFRNRTAYVYRGKLTTSNFVEFLRDHFYNPKRYHKMMYKTGPTPYSIPAPVRLYLTAWDYLSLPEVYNSCLLLLGGLVITGVRIKLRRVQLEAKKQE